MIWLKSLVIILGILIFFCLFLLGYGFYKKSEDPGWRFLSSSKFGDEPEIKELHLGDLNKAIKIVTLKLPKTCSLKDYQISQDYLLLISDGLPTCRIIFIISLRDYSLLGKIVLDP